MFQENKEGKDRDGSKKSLHAQLFIVGGLISHWEIEGRFRKRVVLANVPSFRFFVPGEHANVPSFRFFVPGEHPNIPSFRFSLWGNILPKTTLLETTLLGSSEFRNYTHISYTTLFVEE